MRAESKICEVVAVVKSHSSSAAQAVGVEVVAVEVGQCWVVGGGGRRWVAVGCGGLWWVVWVVVVLLLLLLLGCEGGGHDRAVA